MAFWHDGASPLTFRMLGRDQGDDGAAGESRVGRPGRDDRVAAESGEDLREALLLDQAQEVGEQLPGAVGHERVDGLDDGAAVHLSS